LNAYNNSLGSPWRDKISLAILELQEKGVIQILYDKWWKNTGDVCNRDDKSKESKANALGVENIGEFRSGVCGVTEKNNRTLFQPLSHTKVITFCAATLDDESRERLLQICTLLTMSKLF
jgi:hypothetical protein